MDASLDTATVARVGALLKEKSQRDGTQFLVVSHRPEMQDSCCRVAGVYLLGGQPRALSVAFASKAGGDADDDDEEVEGSDGGGGGGGRDRGRDRGRDKDRGRDRGVEMMGGCEAV